MLKFIIDAVVLVLAVLAIPVLAIHIHDRLVLAPKRPLIADGEVAPGGRWARIAGNLLPFVLIGAAIQLDVRVLYAWFQKLVVPLSFLAIPVVLLCLYETFVLAPPRPRTAAGFKPRPPLYIRIAFMLLPFVIAAVVLNIGVGVVFGWVKEISIPLSWVAAPVGLWCIIDSWFFAPRRQAAAGPVAVKDPPLVRAAYVVLPVLVVAVIVRMITAETLDFSLVLLVLSIVTGLIWMIDSLVFRKQRAKAIGQGTDKGTGGEATVPEPGTVDYARSFFPVAVIVLLVRAFIFEPFRIPSDSMMPTLLDGDFIVVNKYAYGLRLPIVNQKVVETGSPQRGDVVVFRHPPQPEVNFIKRLVGLPGDRIAVRGDHLIINGELIAQTEVGDYTDGCYVGFSLSVETLGQHAYKVMSCRSEIGLMNANNFGGPLPTCDRKGVLERGGGYVCRESGTADTDSNNSDLKDFVPDGVVPAGHYLMIGDNRDNSLDSRSWGMVPEANLVGKATRIWLNFDPGRKSLINLERIGTKIE
jgi:signal peptidase I